MDDRSPAEVYRDRLRALRADVGFKPEIMPDGSVQRCYRGPRGEAGMQAIYRGQVPERMEQDQ